MQDILIVEDGLHERERLAKLFALSGFTISSAESAQEAEKLLGIQPFRLAILDVGLGDKSGSYLFELIKRSGKIPFIIILTGNPSVHLKQRFLDEGAVHYIVKASPAAENESLLETVRSLLGSPRETTPSGIALTEFLQLYVTPSSRELFLDSNNRIASCSCGSDEFIVTFSHKTQLPPLIEGRVICESCNQEMDPKIG